MEQYRTEEEQVEALRRWWKENGTSTIAAVVIAASLGVGYQTWQGSQHSKREQASDLYQAMLQTVGASRENPALGVEQGIAIGEQLKENFGGTTYAQFAALHLARIAVNNNDLAEAEAQLRWVLGEADKGSDTEQLAQLRLARVLAASGDSSQALAILDAGAQSAYQAPYAVARGDILLGEGRDEEARLAYTEALSLAAANPGQVNMMTLQQKLQSLNPVPARELQLPAVEAPATVEDIETAEAEAATEDDQEE